MVSNLETPNSPLQRIFRKTLNHFPFFYSVLTLQCENYLMKRYLFLIVLSCSILSGFAQNSSSINFIIKNIGINVDGHFNTFKITTDFDAEGNLNNIFGKIKVASIRTGIESRDEHLLKEDYFDVENHEFIILEGTAINKKTDNVYKVIANLSIKGITKEISITINIEKTSYGYKVSSNFEINRKDFKVGGSSFVLSKTAKINVIHYQKL